MEDNDYKIPKKISFSFTLTPDEHEELKKLARAMGLTKTQTIRTCIRCMAKRREKLYEN